MGFDPIILSLAVNKTKAALMASGGVGYTETVVTEILPETMHNFQPNEDFGGLYASTVVPLQPVIDYEIYTVNWNGTEYKCACDTGMFGNRALVEKESVTNEPFFFLYDYDQNICLLVSESTGEVTYSVKKIEEEVYVIDGKYLTTSIHYKLNTQFTYESETNGYGRAVDSFDKIALTQLSNRSDTLSIEMVVNGSVETYICTKQTSFSSDRVEFKSPIIYTDSSDDFIILKRIMLTNEISAGSWTVYFEEYKVPLYKN